MTKKKKPKQMQIPGTERKEIPAIEKAAEAFREANSEKIDAGFRAATAKRNLIAAIIAARDAGEIVKPVYIYHDEHGEEIRVALKEDPGVEVKKTGEAESDVGEGVEVEEGPKEPPVHPGLIRQALASQEAAGVAESDDGDIEVPEVSAPKRTAKKKAAAKKKKGKR